MNWKQKKNKIKQKILVIKYVIISFIKKEYCFNKYTRPNANIVDLFKVLKYHL